MSLSDFRRHALERLQQQLSDAKQGLHPALTKVVGNNAVDVNDKDAFVKVIAEATSELTAPQFFELYREANTTNYETGLTFDFTKEMIKELTDDLMEYTRRVGDAVAAVPEGTNTFENTVLPFVKEEEATNTAISSLTFLTHVSAEKELRDASSEAEKALDAFAVEQNMRMDIYKSVRAYAATKPDLDGEKQRFLKRLLREFERNGLHLDDDKRARVKDIQTRMGELSIEFQKNLGEESTKIPFTADELEGLPADNLARLEREGDKYVMTLNYPDYFPAMKYVRVEETRKTLEKAFMSRCMKRNTEIMEELVKLRAEKAKLLGWKNHSAFILNIRMAETPEAVFEFIDTLSKKLDPVADADMAALKALKEAECKERSVPYDGKINMWDIQFYQRLREENEYGVDHEAIKQYFPLPTVTKGLLEIYQLLLGLKFEQIQDPHVWHPDVSLYEVRNSSDNSLVGHFYLDLHPRDGKYGHAAMFGLQASCRRVSSEEKDARQLPAAAMVANFTKPTGDKPSLLGHKEVVTYFHEFGHVMHHVCSLTEYVRFAGTRVERDFVEAPSQMLENWCYEAEALRLMSGHHETGEPLPDDLLQKLSAAKNANAGLLNKRQLVFGLFDQRIHTADEADTAAVFAQTLKDVMKMDATPNTNFAAGFGHLAGGYDSTYYGYMWSEVYSADMFYTRFKAEGILNPDVGRDYREKILQVGASRDAMESLKDFLGREPQTDAFLKAKGLSQ